MGRFVGKQALCLFRLHWLGGWDGPEEMYTHTHSGPGRAAGGALGASARHRRLVLTLCRAQSPLPTDHGVGEEAEAAS